MRFLMLMIPGVYQGDGQVPDFRPDPDAVEKMMAYNKRLAEAGALKLLDGLHPPSAGARVTYQGGAATVVEGPFPGARDVVGGYWIIDVKDRAEAIEWARQVPAAETDMVEVRQIFEMTDFPPEVQDKAVDLGL